MLRRLACILLLSGISVFGGESHLPAIAITLSPEAVASLASHPTGDVPALLRLGDQLITNVHLHVKGHGSFRPITDKPSFSIRSPAPVLLGRKKLLLNNSHQDRSFLRWKLASEMFRAAGVPAPDVSYASVTLNGKPLGLYIHLEPTDKKFLQRAFQNGAGNLYEGGNNDVGDQLDQDNGTPDPKQADLKRLAEASAEPNVKERWRKLSNILDIDRFVSFVAVEILVDHRDGYTMDRNNFRLYHDPFSDKFVFLPHGLDWILASPHLAPSRPLRGNVALAVLRTPEGRDAFEKRFDSLAHEFYGDQHLLKRLDKLWAEIKNDADPEASQDVERLRAIISARISDLQRLQAEH